MANIKADTRFYLKVIAGITTFILFLSLLLLPTNPVISADEVKWSRVTIPTEGKAGNWLLADGSDIQHLTMAADGTLYAYVTGLTYTLYSSTNDGYSWSQVGNVQDNIVGITTAPTDPNIIYYATTSGVYRSADGGKTFITLPANPGG
ncbi:WD40/YVTN/BNR-like repeat-containing protein, partial [Chloroflexota bacterium]